MLIAVDPIVTMFRVFVLVLGTCATTSIIIPKSRKHKEESDHSLAMSAHQ
jgi:Na+/H+-dicarboxylate symporter